MGYLKAVLKKDHEKKIQELEKLILLGKKLNKITTPDEKKLEILLSKSNNTDIEKSVLSNTNNYNSKSDSISKSKKTDIYNIENIQTSADKITIVFDRNIDKEIIKFFELKQTPYYKDVFDIDARFEKINSTHLNINNIEKINIGQFKFNVFRLVLTDKRNIKTSYFVDQNKIIININESKKVVKESNNFIDEKNLIRTIYTDDNSIRIKFNKTFGKNDFRYAAFKHNNNYIHQFDIKGKYKYSNPIKLSNKYLDKITVLDKGNTTRIRITNKDKINIRYIKNKRNLIIKIPTVKKTSITNKPYIPKYKSKVIVIDAGHGAKDSGAVGPNKRYEKVVTLEVAKYLYKMLKEKGHKVYLTRKNDRFIKVMNRTTLANEKNADIFISIHANSVPKSKAHRVQGIETFFLSPARSERAKRVAAKENSSDISSMSNSSKLVFLESLNRPRITASHKFAIDVHAGMLQSVKSKFSGVKDSGVREGPFWVLVGAQMPSILIELGYISHPRESKRLYNKEYQKLLAKGIATGVDSYFSKNP